MSASPTPDEVLDRLNDGCRTIWDLAASFDVPADDTTLRLAIDRLIADGHVTASNVNIFSATLHVTADNQPTP